MMLLRVTLATAVAALLAPCAGTAATDAGARTAWPNGTAVVTYANAGALDRALARRPATVVARIPALQAAVLRPAGSLERYAVALAAEPGIVRVERASPRRSLAEPALLPAPAGVPLQWQHAAIHADLVPPEVAAAATGITIAIIDTGADLAAPDLAAKAPVTYSVRSRTADVADLNGHGTFVAALAAGSGSNGDGIAGVAAEARLMVVQAGGASGAFTDVEEAAAIVYAVDHGADVLNLSLGGPSTSTVERRAIQYAASRGALLVAAVGNSAALGSPVEYPAALLQPVGSRGVGGVGLAVGASNRAGGHASFSSTGSHLSLAAPGEDVFSALSSRSSSLRYPRTVLPGSSAGLYGFGSGTSFSAPQVAGAAALVWAANPRLHSDEVADILEETASGHGTWSPTLGFGIIDVAAAVARAQERPASPQVRVEGQRVGSRVELVWSSFPAAATFAVSLAKDGGPARVLSPAASPSSASYTLTRGSVYSFTVAAFDASGALLARSAPWTVSLRPAAARLSLKATRLAGARRFLLDARLAVAEIQGAQRGRTLVLESHRGGRWVRIGTAATDTGGRALWRSQLAPGSYRLRARYPGTTEIAPATSAPVALKIT